MAEAAEATKFIETVFSKIVFQKVSKTQVEMDRPTNTVTYRVTHLTSWIRHLVLTKQAKIEYKNLKRIWVSDGISVVKLMSG